MAWRWRRAIVHEKKVVAISPIQATDASSLDGRVVHPCLEIKQVDWVDEQAMLVCFYSTRILSLSLSLSLPPFSFCHEPSHPIHDPGMGWDGWDGLVGWDGWPPCACALFFITRSHMVPTPCSSLSLQWNMEDIEWHGPWTRKSFFILALHLHRLGSWMGVLGPFWLNASLVVGCFPPFPCHHFQ